MLCRMDLLAELAAELDQQGAAELLCAINVIARLARALALAGHNACPIPQIPSCIGQSLI